VDSNDLSSSRVHEHATQKKIGNDNARKCILKAVWHVEATLSPLKVSCKTFKRSLKILQAAASCIQL